MIEVLESLSAQPGILGSLVATLDGIVVASKLSGGLDEDTAAAQVSSLLIATKRLLDDCQVRDEEEGGDAKTGRVIVRATRGKIVIMHLGNAYLVVVTDGYLDLKHGLIEIQSAARQLKRLGRITVC